MNKKFIGVIVTAVSIASLGFFIGSTDEVTGTPAPIQVDGKTVTFDWTDDNTGEDFIIYTNQQTYTNGVSHAEVYVALQNVSGQEQDVELLAYFRDNKKKISDIKVLEVYEKRSTSSELYEVCDEITEMSATTSEMATTTSCYTENGTSTVSVSTSTRWVDVPLVGRDPTTVANENAKIKNNPIARKPVENFTAPKKSAPLTLPADGVLYYKVLIEYPPKSDDNFYFEAVGSKGGYSHLDPWFDSNWTYRIPIEINPTYVDSTLSSFPVYVDLSTLPSDFHTNVKSDGCDIRMVESDETTETAFDLVDYDSVGDAGELHFMADSISSSATSTFYIYYGNSGASCYASSTTFGSQNVWTDYAAVFHMNDASGGITNSTGGTGGTELGTPVYGSTGQLGDGIYMDGTEAFTGLDETMIDPTQNLTFQGWHEADSDIDSGIITFGNSTNDTPVFQLSAIGGNGRARMVIRDDSSSLSNSVATGLTKTTMSMYHGVRRTSGNTTELYFNASSVASDTTTVSGSVTFDNANIGLWDRASTDAYYTRGILDEVRVKQEALSTAWIDAEYDNHSTPTPFYFVGTQETDTGGGGGAVIPRVNAIFF